MSKKIKIIKNRSDIGAGTRGADMGIDAIEIAAINMENDYFNKYEFIEVNTYNEAIYDDIDTKFALRIDKVLKVCTQTNDLVKNTVENGFFPLVISGDHSSALGTIAGLKNAYPDKKLGVVWIDAHGDLHSPYTTPSGNIHGMPLAASLAEDNISKQVNTLDENTINQWNALKNIGGISPKVESEDLVFFGVRDTENPEDYIIESKGIKNYKVAEVRYRGIDLCIKETLEKLKDCDHIYISFDVDSMDCDLISYGTGTPVPKGFDEKEIKKIINGIYNSGKVSCIEFVEVNPCLDSKGNVMAETAFDVLKHITKNIEEK